MELNENSNAKIQPNEIVDSTQVPKEHQKFYNTKFFVILMIFLIPIVGLILLVRKKDFSKFTKAVLYCICFFNCLIFLGAILPKNNVSTPNPQSISQSDTAVAPKTNEQPKNELKAAKDSKSDTAVAPKANEQPKNELKAAKDSKSDTVVAPKTNEQPKNELKAAKDSKSDTVVAPKANEQPKNELKAEKDSKSDTAVAIKANMLPKNAFKNVKDSKTGTVIPPNTSQMVDYLVRKGREDAKSATNEQLAVAYVFIQSNLFNLHKDNDTMEKTMYYGSLLEHHFGRENAGSSAAKDIGRDAVQAVKYVYRGSETVDSPDTRSNIKQIVQGFIQLNEYLESKK